MTLRPAEKALIDILAELECQNTATVRECTRLVKDREAPKWNRLRRTVDYLVSFAPSYRKRYLQRMYYCHKSLGMRSFRTEGLYSLDLNRVYVERTVDLALTEKASADPIIQPLPTARHSIWTFLGSPEMKQHNFVILGGPGSGKTTLLKHVTLELAGNPRSRPLKLIPVLLFMRDHAASIAEKPTQTIVDIAEEAVSRIGLPSRGEWFSREFKRGRCLVMLDGLDEVAEPTLRKAVADWVDKQVDSFSRNRFLVTSRPLGYIRDPLSQFTVLGVAPFRSEQIKTFIDNWYLENEVMSARAENESVQTLAQEGAMDLFKRIQSNRALYDLAVNPLMLTMIATVHRYRGSLPRRRVELYAEMCEVSLGNRDKAQGLEVSFTSAQKIRILRVLAYEMMRQQVREISEVEAARVILGVLKRVAPTAQPRTFLLMVEAFSGILVERESGMYSFLHLTFQEYLASLHVKEETLVQELAARVTESWWYDTIRLYAAQADASPIVEACLFWGNLSDQLEPLILAIDCEREALELRTDLRQEIRARTAAVVEKMAISYWPRLASSYEFAEPRD
jgi:predicted NACHT family NTPase